MIKLFKHMKTREIVMICLACILICVEVYFELKIPECINKITNITSSQNQDINALLPIGVEMLLYICANVILSIFVVYLSSRIASGFTFTLRKKLFNKVLCFGEKEISKSSIPSLITRTTNDITQIQLLISTGLQIIVKSPITAIWAIMKIIDKNWQISVLTGCFIVFVCICISTALILGLPKFRLIQKLTDSINTIVRENIKGINVVHAFNAEEYQNNKFEKVNTRITGAQIYVQKIISILIPLIDLTTNGLWFTIYWLGAALLVPMDVSSRVAFFSDIVAFAMYANYVLTSFMMMAFILIMWPPAQASGERIAKVFNNPINIKDVSGHEKFCVKSNLAIEFNDVNFKYPDDTNHTLKDINFSIESGQTLGIIGPNGSGKTTLAKLMIRFYENSSGSIKIFGNDIQNIKITNLYNTIYMATQQPVIFYGTIKDNLLFGKIFNKTYKNKIETALEISQLSDFISSLKYGINTKISQEGKDLSGGQKQRLSIARAIIRDPKILIFDDCFSALDYKTDAKLRAGLSIKLPNTTKIIIAQRIGTIKNADKILVLDNGLIVGIGSHEELLNTCNTYKKIAKSQSGMINN